LDYSKILNISSGSAVCYSGFREGQTPGISYPTYDQVKEDLLIIEKNWNFIRLYSCDHHSKTVLEVIKQEKLNIKVMLGCYIEAEKIIILVLGEVNILKSNLNLIKKGI